MSIVHALEPKVVHDSSLSFLRENLQPGLMIVATAAAVLSLIPPVRFVGATLMRSVVVLSSMDHCRTEWCEEADWKKRAMLCVKVAAAGLGVAAIVTTSPALLVAALVTEIGIQVFEMIKASSWEKKLIHLGFIAVNITVLAGIVFVSWELLLAASIASAVALVIFGSYLACKAKSKKDVVNMACYFAMAGVSIASGVMVSHLTRSHEIGHYERDGVRLSTSDCGRNVRGATWVHEYYSEYDMGGRLDSQYYNTLPIGTHTLATAHSMKDEVQENNA